MTAGWTGPTDRMETGYLERVAEDIQLILGAGIEIDAVEIVEIDGADAGSEPRSPESDSDRRRTGLRARYHLGERTFETTAAGESLIDAHRHLRARLVVDRLRLTFSETVEPRRGAKRLAGRLARTE